MRSAPLLRSNFYDLRSASDKALLLQELPEHLEPHGGVVDLEHALLDRQGQWQDLGETVADPGRIAVVGFGGEVLRDFAFALVVGVALGTYSTIAAASLIVDWETWSQRRQPGGSKKAVVKAAAGR